MIHFRTLTVYLSVMLFICNTAEVNAQTVRQKLKILKENPDKKTRPAYTMIPHGKNSMIISEEGTEITFIPDSVGFLGYDKQLTSTKESLFIVNKTGIALEGVKFVLKYSDMSGRMLHSRTVTIHNHIPPMETRKVDFTSWDSQNSFYYHLSAFPRREATPYNISLTPQAFFVESNYGVSY